MCRYLIIKFRTRFRPYESDEPHAYTGFAVCSHFLRDDQTDWIIRDNRSSLTAVNRIFSSHFLNGSICHYGDYLDSADSDSKHRHLEFSRKIRTPNTSNEFPKYPSIRNTRKSIPNVLKINVHTKYIVKN